MAARVNGRWVVTQQWVTDSYTNGQWLNEAGFLFFSPNTRLTFVGTVLARVAILASMVLLLGNVCIFRKRSLKHIPYWHNKPERLLKYVIWHFTAKVFSGGTRHRFNGLERCTGSTCTTRC